MTIEEGYYGFGMNRVIYVKPGYDSKKYRKSYESHYGEVDEMITLEKNGYFDAGHYGDFSKTRTFVVDTCFTEYSYGYDTMIDMEFEGFHSYEFVIKLYRGLKTILRNEIINRIIYEN